MKVTQRLLSIIHVIIFPFYLLFVLVGLTVVVRETYTQMDFLDLLFKKILLVEKKYDGGQSEESVVADAVE